ncbi:MAG: histidine phosphatase family protein [Rhodobacteraceae bacterium]|nr:histidine phosphatase family protein [Paracoccaceae bacterium]
MAELLVIRHGQASFGAGDAAAYDQLTDLGYTQSRLLGDLLRDLDWVPDRVVTGTLARHRQTLDGIGFDTAAEEHAGWNEYDFHDLLTAKHSGVLPENVQKDRQSHFRALKTTLREWQDGGLTGASENWTQFSDRVEQARSHAVRAGAERVLVVSSGGVIGKLVSATLQTPPAQMIALNLQVKNTSMTRFIFTERAFFLSEFNATPHFADNDRSVYMSYS